MNAALAHVRDWVFDLDNTLYPAPALYDLIGERMTAYIARAARVCTEEALVLRERYFHLYGATVVGLTRHHGVDAHDFMAYVHDVPNGVLERDGELVRLIGALPGRKFVFTNGGGGHAERTIERLGLSRVIDAVFDLEDVGFAPKPEFVAYQRLAEICGINPRAALFVEDTLRNLEPAHELGFATALVGPVHPEPRPAYVDYWAPNVKALLRAL